MRDPPLAAAATSLSLLRLKQEKKIRVSTGKKKRLANCVSFESTILLHELLSVSLHNSRDRIVISTLRCGRSNPGSNPGHGNARFLFTFFLQLLAEMFAFLNEFLIS